MVKDHQRDRDRGGLAVVGGKGAVTGERRVLIGLIWNCAAELKLILTALLLLCSVATLLQFLPTQFLPFSSTTIRSCITTTTAAAVVADANRTTSSPPPLEEIQQDGAVKRSFIPVGTAAYSFILMSAYRGGPNSFAIMGLSSKPLHVFGKPIYTCEYLPDGHNISVTTRGYKILPDWGYGRVYTTVVINCTFPLGTPVKDPASGGRLLLHSTVNGGFDTENNVTDTVLALTEPAHSWNVSQYVSEKPKYDYLYCGSSLYGTLSPQRVREWIAYHVRLFGKRSHFVIHDAGGVHAEVLEVLKPWMELGYVTLQDIRDQERFDGYYHNQFLVVNDCLHRYRFATKWMFFFDVDEYIYVPGKMSLRSAMDSLSGYSQFTIEQMPISNKLCLSEDAGKIPKKWGLEKLVYRNVKRVMRRDRKYAVQPRNVFATGVHMSQNFKGRSAYKTGQLMKYFHYHGTIAERREPCRQFVNETFVMVDDTPYVLDTTMRSVAPYVKKFELDTIGSRLKSTRQ